MRHFTQWEPHNRNPELRHKANEPKPKLKKKERKKVIENGHVKIAGGITREKKQ